MEINLFKIFILAFNGIIIILFTIIWFSIKSFVKKILQNDEKLFDGQTELKLEISNLEKVIIEKYALKREMNDINRDNKESHKDLREGISKLSLQMNGISKDFEYLKKGKI